MKILITGASSGIGRDMAKYLLEKGHELYLISRDKKRLQEIFPHKNVHLYCYDLNIEDNCFELYNKLKNDRIDILINNAGFGNLGNFYETDLDKELEMINVNIKAYHILMKLFLKDFTKRGEGRILNVASVSGFMPGPYMATYYATKNYVVSLSLAVYQELKKENSKVKISIFCPGPVKTNFNDVANVKSSIGAIESGYAAKYAIDKMFKNKLIIIPPNMKLIYFLNRIIPIKLFLKINSEVQKKKM